VFEQGSIGTNVFKGVRQDVQTGEVEGAGWQDAVVVGGLGELDDEGVIPGEQGRVNADSTEREEPKDFPKQSRADGFQFRVMGGPLQSADEERLVSICRFSGEKEPPCRVLEWFSKPTPVFPLSGLMGDIKRHRASTIQVPVCCGPIGVTLRHFNRRTATAW